jgi:GNAT superfamily N-acetyltransferase
MGNTTYIKATEADIPTLVGYRVAFLTELLGPQPVEEVEGLKMGLKTYFLNAIRDNAYIGFMAKEGNLTVSIGGMVVREQPGSFKNPTGRVGYIMNMYTLPAYRRRGLCSGIMKRLMEQATELGLNALELLATKEGEPVYQKCGFQKHSEPMYRIYNIKATLENSPKT